METKKIFLKHHDHPQRRAAMQPVIDSGVAIAGETNADGTLYFIPAADYRRIMKVKRYHLNQGERR